MCGTIRKREWEKYRSLEPAENPRDSKYIGGLFRVYLDTSGSRCPCEEEADQQQEEEEADLGMRAAAENWMDGIRRRRRRRLGKFSFSLSLSFSLPARLYTWLAWVTSRATGYTSEWALYTYTYTHTHTKACARETLFLIDFRGTPATCCSLSSEPRVSIRAIFEVASFDRCTRWRRRAYFVIAGFFSPAGGIYMISVPISARERWARVFLADQKIAMNELRALCNRDVCVCVCVLEGAGGLPHLPRSTCSTCSIVRAREPPWLRKVSQFPLE